MTTTTWNSADKSAGFTLSAGDLRAACATGGNLGVRATVGASTGKFYAEWTSHSSYHNYYDGFGIAKTTASFGDFYAGTSGALISNNAEMVIGGSNIGGGGASGGSGTTYDIAVDLVAQLIWGRFNNGDWNGNPSANPATGVGGFDISGTVGTGVEVRPSVSSSTSSIDGTAAFASADWVRTAPSGFLSWDTAGAPADINLTANIADDAGLSAAFPPPCTLNPADISSGMTLSNGNLTASNSGSPFKGARGFTKHKTGFFYFEAHLEFTLNLDDFIGVIPLAAALGPYSNSGLASPPPPGVRAFGFVGGGGAGHDAGTYLFKVNLYDGTIGVAHESDPTNFTTTGGMDFGVDYYPYVGLFGGIGGSDEIVTFNFGASTFVGTLPTGYQSWDESQGTQAAVPDPAPFVMVGNGGPNDNPRAAWSTDGGLTFTAANLPTADNGSGLSWSRVAYSPSLDMYAAVASNGGNENTIAISTNAGHTWSVIDTFPSPNSWTLWDICWADDLGLWVIAAESGPTSTKRILTSPDGTTWTARDLPDAGVTLRSVCWSPVLGMLVAVGLSNAVYTSTDAITWVAATAPATSKDWRSICWAGGSLQRFAMVANGAAGANDYAYWDGSSAWTQQSLTGSAYNWLQIAYGELVDMLVVVGGNTGVVARSTDGETFTQVDSGLGGDPFQAAHFVEQGGFWVVAGNNVIKRSRSAVTWQDLDLPAGTNLFWAGIADQRDTAVTSRLVADFTDDSELDAALHLDIQLHADIHDDLGISRAIFFTPAVIEQVPPVQVVVICV